MNSLFDGLVMANMRSVSTMVTLRKECGSSWQAHWPCCSRHWGQDVDIWVRLLFLSTDNTKWFPDLTRLAAICSAARLRTTNVSMIFGCLILVCGRRRSSLLVHYGFSCLVNRSQRSLTSPLFVLSSGNSKKWEQVLVGGKAPPPRCGHAAVAFGDTILVFGGLNYK